MNIHNEEKAVNKIRINKHPKRKNNDLVAAMYAMYQTGKSLEEIGNIYGKSRQAVYDVFRTRGYPLRSKQLKGLQILDGIKFTIMKGGYLRGSVGTRRMTMQKYVWEKHHGPVPADHVIYHLDRNPANNAIENLAILHKTKQQSVFNPNGLNQFSPGGNGHKKGSRQRLLADLRWERAAAYNVTS